MLIGDRRGLIVVLCVTSIVAAFAEAGTLAIIGQVAAKLASGAKHVHVKLGPVVVHTSIGRMILVALVLTLVRLVLQWPLSRVPPRIATDVGARQRTMIFRAFTRASWAVQSSDREGTLQEIMTNQTAQAVVGALQATGLIISAITFTILLASAVLLSVVAAGLVFIIAIVMFAVLRPLRSLGAQLSRAGSQAQVEYAGGIAEANRLAEETQVFGVTDAQFTRIGGLIDAVRGLGFRTQVIVRLVPNLYQTLIFLVLIGGLAALNIYGGGHAGSLGAVILLLIRASQNGQAVQGAYQGLQQSLPYIERLQEAEHRYARSAPVEGTAPLQAVNTLAFEGVSYAYTPGRPVLSDVSFTVQAGEAIGVVGPSGAGKSTLVQILLQLRTPDSGRYLINGAAVQSFSRADWHRVVAYVPQEPRLLHASVADNVRFFRDIDDEAVQRACRLARIHDDIMSWSHGYDTLVGPRANAVSGGQQQRICLARALAARPQVLVLDEPTSALDPHSETLIQESLTALKSGLTLFTIAHRMSTLDMCDRVMVILDGRLVAFDTKAVLREENHYYRSASNIAAGAVGGILP